MNLADLTEAERAFITLSITDTMTIFSISKVIQELAAESMIDRGESGLGQVLKYIGHRSDLGAEYFHFVSKSYPPDVPVTAYDLMYVRAKTMTRAYSCLGAFVYDMYLVFSHYRNVAALFNLDLGVLPRVQALFCRSVNGLPVMAQLTLLYPNFELTTELFTKVTAAINDRFLQQLRKGREMQSNLQLLQDYLDVRDAFDAELAALTPSLNHTVRYTRPVVPVEHHQALIMLLQEFTQHQVNELETFLLDTVGLRTDKNDDLILNFAALPVDKLHMVCDFILRLATEEQERITTHRVHVLKTLITNLR